MTFRAELNPVDATQMILYSDEKPFATAMALLDESGKASSSLADLLCCANSYQYLRGLEDVLKRRASKIHNQRKALRHLQRRHDLLLKILTRDQEFHTSAQEPTE